MNIYIYGAGKTGNNLLLHLDNYNILGFIDTFSKDKYYNNIPVININDDLDTNAQVVLASISIKSQKEMFHNCLQVGFKHENIKYINDFIENDSAFNPDEIERMNKIKNQLIMGSEDYQILINARNNKDLSLLKSLSNTDNKSNEYTFGLNMSNYEIIIDGGTFDGFNAIQFLNLSNNPKVEVFSFDPFGTKYVKSELLLNNKIKFIKAGLWSKDGYVYFRELGCKEAAGSYISEKKLSDNSIQLKSLKLDTFLKEKYQSKVSYIKMDIEGSELDAIQGGADIIKKYKPDMAICIYHKDTHFYEISEAVLRIVPDYNMWFGHHSNTYEDSIIYFSMISPNVL
jgi:FkbM family methyltransferase